MKNSINPFPLSNLPESSHPSEEYLKQVPWLFRQALHLHHQQTIDGLLNSTTLPVMKKNLLNGMLLAWQCNKKAKSFLEDLLKGSDFVDKLWIFLALSEFYLSQENISDSKHYCDVAIKELSNKRPIIPNYLCSLLLIWKINLKLVDDPYKLNYKELTNELNNIISNSDTKLIRGYAYLILGMLEKLNPANSSASTSTDNFQKAIQELRGVDYYYFSLAQLEMAAYGNLDPSERINLALSAEAKFKQLKKEIELQKATYLLSELPNQPIATTKVAYESIGNCLFVSPAMKRIKDKLEMFVRFNANDPILILGEKGTGKESITSAIEYLSQRDVHSYNCSNLSKELFESIMFGYKKGTFTGANEDRAGLFESAGNGILFLDEIGDLPYDCQPKFLRVLQTREFSRMGEETKKRPFLGRVVAATNKDLKQMVVDGQFRGDLLDRLSVFRIDLPSLNNRREDIIPLAELFLQLHGQGEHFTLSISARKHLIMKDHPANIRGLETTIKRAIVHALSKSTRIITEEFLKDEPSYSHSPSRSLSASTGKLMSPQDIEAYDVCMDKYEKKIILEALEICGGNRKITANSLKLLERRLYLLIKKHGINN